MEKNSWPPVCQALFQILISLKPFRGEYYYLHFTEQRAEAQSLDNLLTITQLRVSLLESNPGVSGCIIFFY